MILILLPQPQTGFATLTDVLINYHLIDKYDSFLESSCSSKLEAEANMSFSVSFFYYFTFSKTSNPSNLEKV